MNDNPFKNGILHKEFEKFFMNSPFHAIDRNSQTYLAMYGAFLGGYEEHQQYMLEMFAKDPKYQLYDQ